MEWLKNKWNLEKTLYFSFFHVFFKIMCNYPLILITIHFYYICKKKYFHAKHGVNTSRVIKHIQIEVLLIEFNPNIYKIQMEPIRLNPKI